MPDLLESPARKPISPNLAKFCFTSETAALARRKRSEYERQRDAMPTPQALARNATLDDFNASRLVRVREQLEKLDAMIEKETDAQKLDRLASAQSRLSEQERILDGRPLPGSRRPSSERASRATIELRPLLADAAPVQVAPAAPVRPAGWEYEDPPGLVREPPAGPPNGPAA